MTFANTPTATARAAADKRSNVDIDALLQADEQHRAVQTQRQELAAEKNAIGKQIGQLAGRLKKATGDEKAALQAEMQAAQARPTAIKEEEQALIERGKRA